MGQGITSAGEYKNFPFHKLLYSPEDLCPVPCWIPRAHLCSWPRACLGLREGCPVDVVSSDDFCCAGHLVETEGVKHTGSAVSFQFARRAFTLDSIQVGQVYCSLLSDLHDFGPVELFKMASFC